jgi:hypothetical protein
MTKSCILPYLHVVSLWQRTATFEQCIMQVWSRYYCFHSLSLSGTHTRQEGEYHLPGCYVYVPSIVAWWIFLHCRVYLDLTSLYTDLISLHHICWFLLLEAFLLTLTLGVYPCFKVIQDHQLLLFPLFTITYSCFQLWHTVYQQSSDSSRKWINLFFAMLYAVYVLGSAGVVCWVVFGHSFPTFLTIAASVEQVHTIERIIISKLWRDFCIVA